MTVVSSFLISSVFFNFLQYKERRKSQYEYFIKCLSAKIYRLLTLNIVIKNNINQGWREAEHNGFLSLVIFVACKRKASQKSAGCQPKWHQAIVVFK